MSLDYNEFNSREFEVHKIVFNLIESHTKVLDLGCATGYFGSELSKKNCKLFGVERDMKAAELAREYYKKIIISDLERPADIELQNKYFDYILLLDVIEHVINRKLLLKVCKKWLKRGGRLILSTPNIAHISVRIQLLLGNFTYTKAGLMDQSHVHFFTKKQFLFFLNEAEYKVEKLIPSADFGQIPFVGRFLRRIPKQIQYQITKMTPALLAPQFIAVCKNI